MATDINEVYKMFPCAKKAAEENIRFWSSEESLNESNMTGVLDTWMSIEFSEHDLYNFFQQIIHYDAFLLRENHIMPWEETKRNNRIEQLTYHYLERWHNALYESPKCPEQW